MHKKGIYERFIKRIMDFWISFTSLVFLLPTFLALALLVRVRLGKPIFFKQERPGKNGKVFTMFKFRTMTNKKDNQGELLPDNIRLTKFGKFLRTTSLDELPGLINIIKGDMSLVGPRPLLVEYLQLYNETEMRRHEVRPGLSGLAQVNGRNMISWSEKFILDIKYVDNIKFLDDVKIIIQTILKVVNRKDISSSNSVTMEKFNGEKQ